MRPSEIIRVSGVPKMTIAERSLRNDLIDLLVDGPSSVGGLYATLVYHLDAYPSLEPARILAALDELEERGFVRVLQVREGGEFRSPIADDVRRARLAYERWLAHASADELAVDEVGLWYELTDTGFGEWSRGAPPQRKGSSWVLDDSGDVQTVVVQGESVQVAEAALGEWFSLNPRIKPIPATKAIVPISSFKLRDGTVVRDGFRISCEYRTSDADLLSGDADDLDD